MIFWHSDNLKPTFLLRGLQRKLLEVCRHFCCCCARQKAGSKALRLLRWLLETLKAHWSKLCVFLLLRDLGSLDTLSRKSRHCFHYCFHQVLLHPCYPRSSGAEQIHNGAKSRRRSDHHNPGLQLVLGWHHGFRQPNRLPHYLHKNDHPQLPRVRGWQYQSTELSDVIHHVLWACGNRPNPEISNNPYDVDWECFVALLVVFSRLHFLESVSQNCHFAVPVVGENSTDTVSRELPTVNWQYRVPTTNRYHDTIPPRVSLLEFQPTGRLHHNFQIEITRLFFRWHYYL